MSVVLQPAQPLLHSGMARAHRGHHDGDDNVWQVGQREFAF